MRLVTSKSGSEHHRPVARGSRRRWRGQSLVEFSLVIMPLFLVLLGIIQFGFIFNAYVTMANASREAARAGSVYVFDRTLTSPTMKAANDLRRNETMRQALLGSMNLLAKTSPNFTSSAAWSQSGLTFTTGDVVVTYTIPAGVIDTDARVGQQVTVRASYHLDLVIPVVANFLSRDAGGRLVLVGESTMVIN